MADFGRYDVRTARWVIDQIRAIRQRIAGLATRQELYALAGASHDQRAIHVRNKDTEDAPAYAVMQVIDTENPSDGVTDYCYLHVQRPTDQYGRDGFYLVNGPSIIPADEYGVAYDTSHCIALAEGSGNNGERYLPQVSSWRLDKDASGSWVLGGADDRDAESYRFYRDGGERIMWFTTPSAGIDPLSGGVYGSALCSLKKVNLAGTAVSLTASLDASGSQVQHRVYNAGADPVTGSDDIQAVLINGVWFANWEEC